MDTLRSRNAPRLFLGLVFITLGLIALLDSLGVVEVEDAWRFWPLLLVALGMARLLRPRGSPGKGWGIVLFVVGWWLLLQNLGIMPFRLAEFWPLLIVLIGARLVWGAVGRGALHGPPPEGSARLSSFALLGGAEHKSNSPDFRGADATAVLGGCKLDLRQASIAGEAVVDTFAMWGGVTILVPREWSVVCQGMPILGGFEDKTAPPPESGGPRLLVRGVVIMGGVEIKN